MRAGSSGLIASALRADCRRATGPSGAASLGPAQYSSNMIELVMFDADGVLFDSTESNVAYYNWIFAKVGEPPLDRDEEISAISYAAAEVFAARARGDAVKLGRMHDVDARHGSDTILQDAAAAARVAPFHARAQTSLQTRAGDQSIGDCARAGRASWPWPAYSTRSRARSTRFVPSQRPTSCGCVSSARVSMRRGPSMWATAG